MKKIILVATILLFSCVAFAESPPIYQTDDIAINGYDPVAYVDFITAKQGKEEFSTNTVAQ